MQSSTSDRPELSTCVHFAYLLLETFIFRSLLRPMVRSAPPPRLIDETEPLPIFPDLNVDDYIAQIIDVDNFVSEEEPAININEEDKSVPIILNAAENCAASMLRLVSRMEAREMSTFWYSCMPLLSYTLIKCSRYLILANARQGAASASQQ
jgi:hypothetical protein